MSTFWALPHFLSYAYYFACLIFHACCQSVVGMYPYISRMGWDGHAQYTVVAVYGFLGGGEALSRICINTFPRVRPCQFAQIQIRISAPKKGLKSMR